MNRIIFLLICLLMLLPGAALAQTIVMDEAHVSFDYPDDTLVLSPQLCAVYAPLLEDAGIDPEELAGEMEAQGVLSRAYSADFSRSFSVLAGADDLSAEIYDISEITDAQRATLRRRAENNRIWETTGLRTQDVEWQKEGGAYWMYIHYAVTRADKTIGRGLRYLTVRNGQYIMLDRRISEGRFSNRDLSAFRARLADLTILEQVERPVRTVALTADIPAETTVGVIEIVGVTTPGAALIAETPDDFGAMQTLSIGEASASGRFTLLVELEEEGVVPLTLTASRDGMHSASVSGSVSYSAKTLPLSGVPESQTVSGDKTTISGTTLAGVQMQLISPYGMSKKRAGNDGTFSFELTTEDEGEHRYTLILDKSGYNQRRFPFTITREITDEQERQRVRKTAVRLSYKALQRDDEENRGAVLRLYGPVTDVSASGSTQYVRMKYSKDAQGRWSNDVVIVAQQDTGAKAGDMLTAVVSVDGVYEEQTADGKDVNVPRLNLLFVDSVE